MLSADFSEVRDLAGDLNRAGDRADADMRRTMKRGAVNIKRDMRRLFSGHSHLRRGRRSPGLQQYVNFDGGGFGGDIEYEIGVDKVGQGNLGNILAYGDGTHGPYLDHTQPLHREAPAVEQNIGDAGERAPLGRGR